MKGSEKTFAMSKTAFGCFVIAPWLFFGAVQLIGIVFAIGSKPSNDEPYRYLFLLAMFIWLLLPLSLYHEINSGRKGVYSALLFLAWFIAIFTARNLYLYNKYF